MTKIKVCGLKRPEDIVAVNAAKPDYCGFVVEFPKSHRSVTVEELKQLSAMVEEGITRVGVFVNSPIDLVAGLLRENVIDMAQLHGDEDEEYIAQIRSLTGRSVIKYFKISNPQDVERAKKSCANYLLLDNGLGTGACFDWSLIKNMDRRFFLAGGLGADNLERAVKEVRPFAVDMSSSLETDKRKDADKIRRAVEIVRSCQIGDNMSKGRFGIHGGQYIPEILMNAVIELEEAYNHYKADPEFNRELTQLFNEYAGRPSNLYYAERMTKDLGGAKVYLKREDLNHTGSHKINNVLGQVLLAKKMGKTRVIAETGAGQHGVATATVAALMGMECEIYMGKEDTERQALNVYRMKLLGAKVHAVTTGTATLKDAVSEAMREWTNRIDDTHYVLGSVMGPHPFPTIVRDFQSVISKEIKAQLFEKEGRLPDVVMACVGGGSNAMGTFYHFIEDKTVRLIGCEAAGRGINTAETAATISTGKLGIFHGMKSYFCQDEYGQIAPVYSISAGLDYPGVGPEHANLYDTGRAEYVAITDDEAVDAFEYLSKTEGIIPAIESAHAIAYARKLVPTLDRDKIVVVTVSGRGDKDCAAMARYRGEDIHE